MKIRTILAVLCLFVALVLVACDQQTNPTATPVTSQGTPSTQELQATIEALQTRVAESNPVVEAPTPSDTAEVVSEATPEPTEGDSEPAPTAEALPINTPVPLPPGEIAALNGHPRLIVRIEDLPRLRSWAVENNPVYRDGLLPVLEQAKADMDSGIIFTEDNASTRYTDYPNEMFAELFAFASLISNDPAARDDYAQRARTLLMRIMNEAAKGYAEGEPYRDPYFPTSDRSRWQGEAYGLTVDWIYPYLSAEDKATIRKVFIQWSDTIVTQGYLHPEPIGLLNDPELVADPLARRWAANNYFNGNMRNLGLMALSLDTADDPGGELGKYLNNAIGARLYISDYVMRNDAVGGMPAEGFEYGGSQLGYILQFLYALYTAGQSDPAVWGQQVSIDNPFWDNFVAGYLQSFSPAPLNHEEFGQVYQAAYYGDGEKYLPVPDFMEAFGPLALYSMATGDTERLDALRWIEKNMVTGGAEAFTVRTNDSYSFLNSILYFMVFDPTAAEPADPRPKQPLNFFAPGRGHILSRTSWSSDAAWFTYNLGWSSIDHQQADGNSFNFYRDGEWLTKERVGYELFTSDYHNTLSLQNDRPDRYAPEDYVGLAYDHGSQWLLIGDGNTSLTQSFGKGYVYGLGDATGLYNSVYESATDFTHVSRSIVWLQPDHIVVYDRVTSKTNGRYKRFYLQTPELAVVQGNVATMTTAKGQQLFNTTLLPQDAEVAAEPPDEWGEANTAEQEPMKFRIRVEAPGGPRDVRFLNVLQGADAGANPDTVELVESSGGTAFAGAVVKGVAVMFPVGLGGSFSGLTYSAPSGTKAHLVTGLTPDAGYDAEVQNSGGSVTVNIKPGSQYKADSGGVLVLGTLP